MSNPLQLSLKTFFRRSTIGSFLTAPSTLALLAAAATKATQVAIGSFFRTPDRLSSLVTRVAGLPGGQTLINFGPAVLVGLATGVTLSLCNRSIHNTVDKFVQSQAANKESRSGITKMNQGGCTTWICSNYPKSNRDFHDVFCDAFRYVENDQTQIIAIADGCSNGRKSQRASRAMVDGFFRHLLPRQNEAAASQRLVMESTQHAQEEIEQNHDESNPAQYYGHTTFLGGIIRTSTDGKRYFNGINCGDCKLYHLQKNGQIVERTQPVRIGAGDSGGRFGANRQEKDKTEKTLSFVVQPGEKLLFMTDGVHDNLDKNPPEDETKEELGAADLRKLSTLQQYSQDPELGEHIMHDVLRHTDKYFVEFAKGTNMKRASHKDVPGKPDHMTLMVVQIK